MTQLADLVKYLEEIAPLHLQESYDNAGLITGNLSQNITGVSVCLDSTEAVVDEAISLGHNVIIAHHPIVFTGLKTFTGKNYIEKTIVKAIKHDIAIYAIHTNLDNVFENGVNQKIANILGVKNQKILMPKNMENPEIGAGIFGELEIPIETIEFLKQVKKEMKTASLKYTRILQESVQKIAICGGSGSFLLDQAILKNCDVFITSDFKYHQFFDANGKIVIADIGHFETEQYTIDLLIDIIKKKFSNFAAHSTRMITNPVNYI